MFQYSHRLFFFKSEETKILWRPRGKQISPFVHLTGMFFKGLLPCMQRMYINSYISLLPFFFFIDSLSMPKSFPFLQQRNGKQVLVVVHSAEMLIECVIIFQVLFCRCDLLTVSQICASRLPYLHLRSFIQIQILSGVIRTK